MAKLSNVFIESTAKAFADETLQKIAGENFPKIQAVVKAAIGINDTDALSKIIVTLLTGLDIQGYMAVRHAINNPVLMKTALVNSAEVSD